MKKNYIRNMNIIILLFSIAATLMIFTKTMSLIIDTVAIVDDKLVYPTIKDYFYGYNFAFKIPTKELGVTRFSPIILLGYIIPILLGLTSLSLFYLKRDSNIKYYILGIVFIILSVLVLYELIKINRIYNYELAADMVVIFESNIKLQTGALLNCFFITTAGICSVYTGIVLPIYERETEQLRRKK